VYISRVFSFFFVNNKTAWYPRFYSAVPRSNKTTCSKSSFFSHSKQPNPQPASTGFEKKRKKKENQAPNMIPRPTNAKPLTVIRLPSYNFNLNSFVNLCTVFSPSSFFLASSSINLLSFSSPAFHPSSLNNPTLSLYISAFKSP